MKTVLVLAFFYPPFDTTAAVEASKLTRYLPDGGWSPLVLSTRSDFAPTLPVEVAADVVHRTRFLDVNRLPKLLTAGNHDAYVGHVPTSSTAGGRVADGLATAWRQLVNVPDGQIGWLPFAVRRGKELLQEHRVDLIFSMAGPFTSHLVASRLSASSGTPWFADFRDLWTDNHHFRRARPARWIERGLERRTLAQASALSAPTPAWAARLQQRFDKPTWLIHNGFDSDDLPRAPPPDRFILTYTGVLYRGAQDMGPLLRAIAVLRDEGAVDSKRFELRLVGRYVRALEPGVRRLGIADLVSFTDTVSHVRALRLQAESAALVFLLWSTPAGSGWLSAKLYEYMASGRPVLAVGPADSDAARLVTEMRAGAVVSDDAAVVSVLRRWLREFELGGTLRQRVDPGALGQYEWRAISRRLAAAFDATVGADGQTD